MEFMDIFSGGSGLAYLLFLLVAAIGLERIMPWRKGVVINWRRWLRNGSMYFYSQILLGFLPQIASLSVAIAIGANGTGLLNWASSPMIAQILITIIIIDLAFLC